MRTSTALALAVFVLPVAAQEFRSLDGTGNNLGDPNMGSIGENLGRHADANYANGTDSVDGSRVNPRDLSNALLDQPGPILDPQDRTALTWAWGQFLDHDISLTGSSSSNGTLGITVPTDDPFFGDLSPNNTINMNRSNFTLDGLGVRQQTNSITAWIDGSNIYGDATIGASGLSRADWLRTNDGTGKLKTSDAGALGDFLPLTNATAPEMANQFMPSMGNNTFVAGDVRANENTALLSLHTVFVREHNRLADIIATEDPTLAGDDIYQRARQIVGAELQAITYNEFLPCLGTNIADYSGYNGSVDASIANEFSTAAYRLHSQIGETLLRLDNNGDPIPQGNAALIDAFFNPSTLSEGGIEPLLLGLAAEPQQSNDPMLTDALRNQLFSIFIPGVGLVDNATDLGSLNIMRGRDHGLGTYNETRLALGLPPANDFDEITIDPVLAAALEAAYGAGNVDDVDLYVGILLEEDVPNAILGELGMAIIEDQFVRLRDGDRFYYENTAGGMNNEFLVISTWGEGGEQTAAEWLNGLSLSEIVSLNTNANVDGNLFLMGSVVPEPSIAVLVLCGFAFLARRKR